MSDTRELAMDATKESRTVMTETHRRHYWSGWSRAAYSGVAIGLTLLLSSSSARLATSSGIDPLEILQLQVRPNIMLVLDSSGSMGEGVNTNGNLANEHPDSKIYVAKQVLNTFVQANQAKVSFMFGQYSQDVDLGLADQNRYVYAAYDADEPNAFAMQVEPGTAPGSANSKMRRRSTACPGGDAWNVCGESGGTIRLIQAARFFNRQTIYVLTNGTYCGVAASLGTVDPAGAYVTIERKNACADATGNGTSAKFKFYGVARSTGTNGWQGIDADTTCGGFKALTDMAACTDNSQFNTIGPFLEPELNFNANNDVVFNGSGETPAITLGTTAAIPAANITIGAGRNDPTRRGIRAGANTPIAESLKDFKEIFSGTGVNGDGLNLWYTGRTNVTAISTQTPVKQRTFAIVVTDGDDTCDTPTSNASGDNPPLRAAYHAQVLYTKITTEAASGVPTFVIALGGGANPDRANWVAYGGSGMVRSTTAYGADSRWSSIPTAAEVAACATCRPAFLASNASALATALQSAIDQAVDSGEFSASGSVVSTVFELTVDDAATTTVTESALDPTTRYNQRINILYQTTFELPLWKGRIYAFRNDGSFQVAPGVNSLGIWEAGQTLYDNVHTYMQTQTRQSRPANQFTFAELHGNETVDSIGASTQALIRRRIFTSARNGKFVRPEGGTADRDEYDSSQTVGRNVVAVWPPNQAGLSSGITQIDDPSASVAGPLDAAMGISTLTFAQLQTEFEACLASSSGGPAPSACGVAGATQTNQARKEAREMLLAYLAGAAVKEGVDGLPLRTAASEPVPNEILYSNRGWLMLDATLASPAVVSPPLRFTPNAHIPEFILYRDGRRASDGQGIAETTKGFGLRNPDFDDANPSGKTSLKPVMTVVYVAANDMLHAFRGGPQCTGGCPGTGEQGSEELWGFIPYDQLGKIRTLRSPGQQKSPHTYVIGSSVRAATIFVPDPDGFVYNNVTYYGHWRTVLYFGRGPGGKYYTALDVTGPGPFTTNALSTNPPWVLWNRGNPDTQDGTSGGTANGTAANKTSYADMGETWSVPAIGNVAASMVDDDSDPSTPDVLTTGDTCAELSSATNIEWRVFTGSGYGEAGTGEGKRFYQLDAVTGDICKSILFPGRSGYHPSIPDNALVAGPSAYNPRAQDAPGTSTPDPEDTVTRVYFPDVQGRIWRYTVNSGNLLYDAGANEPFGNSVALLKINNTPSIFAESGNDNRVPESDGPFRMYGISDTAAVSDYGTPGTLISGFPIDFPAPAPSSVRFRGTVQPTTAFNANSQPRVFFAGTRFNPAGTTDCLSSFDTILFAVSGNNGGAVYDFGGSAAADLYTILSGTKTTGIQAIGGSVLVGDSGSLASAPTPTPNPSPTPTPGPPTPAYVIASNQTTQSPVCRSR
jgi:hypothetical protein